jgi:hypothetical protein
MRSHSPFQPQDLQELDDRLLNEAVAVVPMINVAKGQQWPRVIGLRHDVDNVIEPAVRLRRVGGRAWLPVNLLHPPHRPVLGRQAAAAAVARADRRARPRDRHPQQRALRGLMTGRDPAEIARGGDRRAPRLRLRHPRHRRARRPALLRRPRQRQVRERRAVPGVSAAVDRSRSRSGRSGRCEISPVSMTLFDLEYDANWLGRREYLSTPAAGGRPGVRRRSRTGSRMSGSCTCSSIPTGGARRSSPRKSRPDAISLVRRPGSREGAARPNLPPPAAPHMRPAERERHRRHRGRHRRRRKPPHRPRTRVRHGRANNRFVSAASSTTASSRLDQRHNPLPRRLRRPVRLRRLDRPPAPPEAARPDTRSCVSSGCRSSVRTAAR